VLTDTAKLNPMQADDASGLAYEAKHRGRGRGSGSLDVLRYGRVLKARQLVGVRGAGTAFDGLYYVEQRDHTAQARRVQAELHAERATASSRRWPTVPA
jgi:hypothetical protein